MKVKKASIVGFLLALLLMAGNSCSDDNPYLSNENGSVLETTKDFKLSSFPLERHIWEIPETTTLITIQLRSHTDFTVIEFDATVSIKDEKLWLCIRIPKDVHIPDSDYDVWGILADGKKLGARLVATFKNEMLHSVMSTTVEYGLAEGDGTAENPYIINTADDFNTFAFGLYKDSLTHGANLYFKQGADFTAPPLSEEYTGRNYTGYSFAGTYDGNGHKIILNYTGSNSERDQNIGLFKVLCNGATIKNLTIYAGMRGILKNGGAVAGKAEGNVILENVQVSGNFNDCGDNIGGFIGYCLRNLTAKKCRIYATVNGASSIGGLVGCYENGSLKVEDFTNLMPGAETGVIGLIASGSNVGGIAGAVNSGNVNFSDITLLHSIPQSDIDVKVIYSQGGNSGGLAGKMNLSGSSKITNVQVAASIRSAGNNVGGLIGAYTANQELTLNDCEFNSYLRGNENVGGFIGTASDGTINIDGTQTQIAKTYNGGYMSIEANRNAGGMIGNAACTVKAKAQCVINTQVTAYISSAGGLIGYLRNRTLELENFKFDANMHVYGADATGGIVGQAENSTIKGNNKVTFGGTIPKADSFTSHFPGTVSSGTPSGGASSNGTSMGGIVGYANSSSVTGVCFTGSVFGGERVGGIVGHATLYDGNNSITNCVNNGKTVTNSSNSNTGGIVGLLQYKYGSFEYLVNYGRIEGAKNTGGIVGHASVDDKGEKMILRYLVNTGTITGQHDVGGCVGFIDGSNSRGNEIYDSANYGSVNNSGGGSVGGILGYGNIAHSAIFSCANHGAVNGGPGGDSNVGGICGRFGWHSSSDVYKNNNTELAHCCNRGTVSSDDWNSYVGGVLGRQSLGSTVDDDNWMVHDCYNSGNVPTNHDRNTGGIVGYVDHTSEVKNCVNTGKVEHGNGVVGTRKSAAVWYHHNLYFLEGTGKDWKCSKFKEKDKGNQSTYGGFNFKTIWRLDPTVNNGYPYLQSCPFQFIKL